MQGNQDEEDEGFWKPLKSNQGLPESNETDWWSIAAVALLVIALLFFGR